jgi:tripartite-type tricarboxylate transporter receptor subunit TctC
MMIKLSDRKSSWLLLGLTTIVLVVFGFSWGHAAEKYPTRPINMIVPFAPASGADLGSKVIADKIAEFLGQPLVSVYKPGGGSTLGVSIASKAKPDGYTTLVATITPLCLIPHIKKLDFSMEDFIFLGNYANNPYWIAVKSDARWKTLKDFVDEAKKSPGKLQVATYGKLTVGDINIELLRKYAGINVVDIPYKSTGEALTALVGGHCDAASVSTAAGLLDSGAIRILAAAEEKRLEVYPDIPTFKEFGYPIVVDCPYSLALPKGTPPEIVSRFIDAQQKAFAKYSKEIKEGLAKVEQWPDFRTPEETRKKFKDIETLFSRVTKELGVKQEQ